MADIDRALTIEEAQIHLEKLYNSKNFQKVIQGAKEILDVDQNNQIAKEILKQAQDQINKSNNNQWHKPNRM